MRIATALALTACLLATDAYAQRMRDYSMSPEESMQQGTKRSGNSSGNFQEFWDRGTQQQNPSGYNNRYNRSSGNYDPQLPGQPSSQFMAGYCDPNFKPMLSNTGRIASLNACLDEQKAQACDMFAGLPPEVQKEMDGIIGCQYMAANDGQMDENGYVQPGQPRDCSYGDTVSMQMLRAYWQDQRVAYAIVFLPDMVLNGSSRCMGVQ